jgi:itaconate CoA-transferase
MDCSDIYKSKLTTAAEAVATIPSNSKMAMGMAMAQPPALLQALAGRARAGQVEALRLYYFEATATAGKTVLDFDLADRIEPYCMFVTAADRALIKKSGESERKVLRYVPNNFHQAPRLLIDDIGIDSFVCTVSPMDQHGYLSFGVGNDYSSKVARSAKRLIVEVNRHMPRVLGSGAQIHV